MYGVLLSVISDRLLACIYITLMLLNVFMAGQYHSGFFFRIHVLSRSKFIVCLTVKNCLFYCLNLVDVCVVVAALGLAVARDGSSGGVIRIAIITEEGVRRSVFTGAEIPTFYLD